MLCALPPMLFVVALIEDATMHLGMQGLDPAVQHLRKTGECRNILDGNPCFTDLFGCPASGEYLHPEFGQFPGKALDPRFIGQAYQRPLDPSHTHLHQTKHYQNNNTIQSNVKPSSQHSSSRLHTAGRGVHPRLAKRYFFCKNSLILRRSLFPGRPTGGL